MRTITQIGNSILAYMASFSALDGLTSTSNTAEFRLLKDVAATTQYDTELLFEDHKTEVNTVIALQKPHTLKWYATKAKQYQHGDSLPTDSDVYAVIDATKQIVAYAAAVELDDRIRIKVAKLSGTLAPLSNAELTAFTAYMGRVKDAGIRIICSTNLPEDLRVGLTIYYDPLILDANGERLDGTATTPVKDALKVYLTELPFNGLFIVNSMIDAMQKIEGVRIPHLDYVQSRTGVLAYTDIVYEAIPDAGYLKLDETDFDANITYIPHGPIE